MYLLNKRQLLRQIHGFNTFKMKFFNNHYQGGNSRFAINECVEKVKNMHAFNISMFTDYLE